MSRQLWGAISGAVQANMTQAGRLWTALGLVVTAGLIWLMWRQVDVALLLGAIGRVSAVDVAVALALIAAAYAVKIARWRTMLLALAPAGRPDPGVLIHAETFVGSIALNNLLPLRAGDLARVFAFQQHLGVAPGATLGIMVVERVLDLLLLLGVLAVVTAVMPAGTVPPQISTPLAVTVAAGALAGVAVVAFAGPIGRLISSLADRFDHAWLRAACGLATGSLATIAAQTAGWRLHRLVALTALAWSLEGGLYVVTAQAMHLDQPLAAGYFAFALATLSTLLPSSPGYFGTFHVFAMLGARAFGASANDAAAFSIVTHMLHWLPMTLVGVAALLALPLGLAPATRPRSP